jgi:inhibitor of cysteine peptidase
MSRTTLPLLGLAILILAAVIAGGCMGSAVMPAAGDIRKFSSADEIRSYILNNSAIAAGMGSSYDSSWTVNNIAVGVPQPAAAESVSKGISSSVPSTGSSDHSVTNVQVAGVDEPDFVKNDGRYIYVISGQSLAIVDAYPAISASIVSKTTISDTPKDLFIDGDRLVLFTVGTDTASVEAAPAVSSPMKAMPYYYRSSLPTAHAIFYDISDRDRP